MILIEKIWNIWVFFILTSGLFTLSAAWMWFIIVSFQYNIIFGMLTTILIVLAIIDALNEGKDNDK